MTRIHRRLLHARGYSLPLVILLLAVLATAIVSAVVIQSVSAQTTRAAINRRQAFYACDGIGRAAMVASRSYMRTDATPTPAELMTAVCGAAATCPNASTYAPAGYTVGPNELQLSTPGTTTIAPLPSGPFRGMNARQADISLVVDATEVISSSRCRVSQTVTLGEIGLFQFFFFSDGYMDVFPAAPMDVNGRVHVNGDFCAAPFAGVTMRFANVTASGRIRASCANHTPTRTNQSTAASGTLLYMNTPYAGTASFAAATFSSMNDSDYESACTTCAGGATDWRAFAQARWAGNVLDREHEVPALRMPFVGAARVQDGMEQPAAAAGDRKDNAITMRALVDPVRSTDGPDVREQKLAFKADLRIINGVWYKRDPLNPTAIGIPIWSDHPGNFTTTDNDVDTGFILGAPQNVGQAQLNVSQAWAGAPPRRYSAYVYDSGSTTLLMPPAAPVVSYGTLHRTGAGVYALGAVSGAVTVAAATANALLVGTQNGFVDRRADGAGAPPILPLNFNVAAFADALQDGAQGELGDHFPDGPDAGNAPDFNGIVFVANLWPNSLLDATFGNAAGNLEPSPVIWPAPSSANLPFNVCGTAIGADFDGASGGLTIPDCAGVTNRPSALRVFNASSISMDMTAFPGEKLFPRGLSIVSNGPVYSLGDTNTASTTAGQPPSVDLNGTWKPMMIAGDAITLLSNDWSDGANRWTTAALTASAALTTWNVAIIAGNVETEAGNTVHSLVGVGAWGGGLNNFARFIESWGFGARTVSINGSFVNAFRSVYARQPFSANTVGVFQPPFRDFEYDEKLSMPSDQPPGTPSFFVQAIRRWQRD